MAEVELEDVWKRFPDGTEAIKGLNLSIDHGEFVILVGPSGCGKSTALRMVAGLEEITKGKITIGTHVVNNMTPRERDIAMVFQSYALYPHMTVAENMGFALKLAKLPKSEIKKRVGDAADILGLREYLERKPRALSGGQRQRVAMGRAIVRSPQAFLMDEPLSNLDAKLRVAMRAEIAQLQDRLGVTTLYVTHDQVEAMTMGDRVAVLKRGVLQQVASPKELYAFPENLFVAGFIGSPAMNIVQGKLDRTNDMTIVRLGSVALGVPDAAIGMYPRVNDQIGNSVAVGLRPEHFFFPDRDTPADRRLKVKIDLVEALGSDLLVHFKLDAHPIASEDMREAVDDDEVFARLQERAEQGTSNFIARLDPTVEPQPGDEVELAFNTEKMHFFEVESGHALR